MVVVPHRPAYNIVIFVAFLVALLLLCWLMYGHGRDRGLLMQNEFVGEKERTGRQLVDSLRLIGKMRREIAELQVAGDIDDRAGMAAWELIESMQERIFQQSEQINFYKEAMLPNVAGKALGMERLYLNASLSGGFRYSLLLTRMADKPEYVEGKIHISVSGKEGDEERVFSLGDLDNEKEDAVQFRFKHFQDVRGEMILPEGFEPREVTVVARLSGRRGRKFEKTFDWKPVETGNI